MLPDFFGLIKILLIELHNKGVELLFILEVYSLEYVVKSLKFVRLTLLS